MKSLIRLLKLHLKYLALVLIEKILGDDTEPEVDKLFAEAYRKLLVQQKELVRRLKGGRGENR